MCSASHESEQESLFPNPPTTTPEREMFQWEIEVRGEKFMVTGVTQRDAFTELGRAMGSTGQPETCYRHALQNNPKVLSQTPTKFLEQK